MEICSFPKYHTTEIGIKKENVQDPCRSHAIIPKERSACNYKIKNQ